MEFKENRSEEEVKEGCGDIEMQSIQQAKKKATSHKIIAFAASTHRSSGAHQLKSEETSEQEKDAFPYSSGLTSEEAAQRLEQYGPNELKTESTPKWYQFLEQFWRPMAIMIWIAAIIEAAIMQYPDMAILFGILIINASIAFYESSKAGDAVAALKRTLIPTATVTRDGQSKTISATEVVPGDLVLLASGSAVPADCRVNGGEVQIDESALTGESMPVPKYRGDSCKMGSTVAQGEVQATVESTGKKTFVGRTASLMQNKGELSNFQRLLLSVVIILFVAAAVFCIIVFVYLLFVVIVQEALSFTVVLLVASIPIAIEIVTTTTLALGSRELAEHGAIVTRLSAIEDLASIAILCSDKTGTLTLNKMVIQEETPVYKKGESQYSLLRYAAMAAKWWELPRDALDTLTLTTVDMPSMSSVEQLAYMPFDPIVKRTEGTVREKQGGTTYKTTKGAPNIILQLVLDQGQGQEPGEPHGQQLRQAVESDLHRLGSRGVCALGVAKTNAQGRWELLGLLTFLDPPRGDTAATLKRAADFGVAVKMITGDHLLIARETARKLGMGDYIKNSAGLPKLDPHSQTKPDNLSRDYGDMCLAADGFAQVFPEHKYLIVECLRELGYKTGMTGDGVNDAPALKRADVGVAVQGATDAARAAADIVLTHPGLSTIVEGIRVARCIFVRIRSFLTYRFAASAQLLLFFFIAVFAFKPIDYMPDNYLSTPGISGSTEWPAFFSMPVLMLMLITLLNDGTLIAIGYDNAEPRMVPERWNLAVLTTVSMALAVVMTASTLLLLYLSLTSWEQDNVYQAFGLGGLSYGQITTSIYLQLSVSQFLTLFTARTGPNWFWTSLPSWIVLAAAAVSLAISTVLAITWPQSVPDGIPTLGLGYRQPYALPVYIWIYCLVCFVVEDVVKVGVYALLVKYNIFGYNDTGKLVLPASALQYIAEHKQLDLENDV